MTLLRPLPGAGGTVHDLARLDTLSDAPDRFIILSERSLYVLENLVADGPLEAQNFAVEILDYHYLLAQEDDPEWVLRQSVIDGIQREVLEMPTVTELLQDILDELQAGVKANKGAGASISDFALNLDAGAGINLLNSTDPDEDEAWLIEAIWACNNVSPSEIVIYINEGGNYQAILPYGSSVAGVGRALIAPITLPPGAIITAQFWNCLAGDDLYLFWHGHTMPLVS